jgi:hypothetical protein
MRLNHLLIGAALLAWVVGSSRVAEAQMRPGFVPTTTPPRTAPFPTYPIRPVPTVSPPHALSWPRWIAPQIYTPPIVSLPRFYYCWGGVWTPVYCVYSSPYSVPLGYRQPYHHWLYPSVYW